MNLQIQAICYNWCDNQNAWRANSKDDNEEENSWHTA